MYSKVDETIVIKKGHSVSMKKFEYSIKIKIKTSFDYKGDDLTKMQK